jgi:hypothetical protein
MTDEELLRAFETGELEDFPHELHVRVAWCYLQRAPILDALASFRRSLQRFAAGKGKADRYHETITIAYMLIIAERLAASRGLSWPEFAACHPDLLQRQPSVLARYYSDEVIASARARDVFVLPGDADTSGPS